VDRLKAMNHVQLHKHLRRLERDVEDFRVRAAREAVALECNGRSVISDPLHQRLTSIHSFLRDQLILAEREMERRKAMPVARSRWSVDSILRALPFTSGG
jgi:hypothetical protein